MSRRVFQHRDALLDPTRALWSQVAVVAIEGEWWLHLYARGVRAGQLRMPVPLGMEALDSLIPPAFREELEPE